MSSRLKWVDQARGLGIFLVIYGHNFPVLETHIYSFHIPLFFFIAGMFHPKNPNKNALIKRARAVLVPYFLWSVLLYIFWVFIGRHFGNSLSHNIDPVNGLIGVFYAQGGMQYMDWGIPMWFLPCIFLTFTTFYFVQKIKPKKYQIAIVLILFISGFVYPSFIEYKLPWSLDVAFVSLIFYASGFYLKQPLMNIKPSRKTIAIVFACLLPVVLSSFNTKVDMYRSTYGNILFFIINGFSGTFFTLMLFKSIKIDAFFDFLGRNTIPLLALQGRSLTVIKAILIGFGITNFSFNEYEKFLLVFVQILIMLPIILLSNKYLPLINGKLKR